MSARTIWKKVNLTFIYLILIILALVVLVPIIWIVVSSFQTDNQIFENLMPFSWKAFFPQHLNFSAYVSIFSDKHFGRALFNSFFVTFTTVIIGVFFSALCGFAFAVFDFKGKDILFFLVLITIMIPFEAIAIHLYQVVNMFKWLNTYQALIIPGIGNGLTVFLFRQFFLNIPKDYIDACKIDGASWWTIFSKIYIPLSIPVVICAGLILFIRQWEAFLWPLIAANSVDMRVIQIAISNMSQEYVVFWSQIFAASSVAVVIPALLIIPLQHYYVQGIASFGIKG